MLIKPDWNKFKAKFSENPQDNFEWFCYLLFSKEYNQPYGTHRYKNQSGIETDPIQVGNEIIGWQSKFYEDSLSTHKEDLIGTLEKSKRDYPNITKIILYTNSEWGQGQGQNDPKAKRESEKRADELGIKLMWRTKSYFESLFVCKDNENISRYFFKSDIKWELTNQGFIDTLYLYYKDKFKTISFLIDNNTKPIEDIYVNLAIIKDKKEAEQQEDTSKLISREPYLQNYEDIYKPKEPIEIAELVNISSKSLIYGKAGIGKTTLCKYIAYMWSKGELYQEFDYVVYISLREWETKGLKGAIKDNYYSQDEEDIALDIRDNAQKILFLFDGYDELTEEKKKLLKSDIKYYALTHYIITSRPYGYQQNDFSVDEYFETIGFTDENVENYIDNFFKETEEKKKIKEFLQNNISIKHISYIPLMLEMICTIWKEKSKDNEILSSSITMTELYGEVIKYILKEYAEKKEDRSVYRPRNRKEIKNILGKIAFDGLKNQTILFDGDFLEDVLDDIDFFENSVVNSGFLKSDCSEKDMLDNQFEFPHLTFQEYLSALYVSRLSKDEQSEIIQAYKFYPHFQVFFAFLAGLIKDKEFLLETIEGEPKDIVGFYELILISDCLNEIKENEVDNNFIENINDKMIKWFLYLMKFANYEDEHYKIILHKIKINKYFHNQKILNILVDFLEESSIYSIGIKEDVATIIPFISKDTFNFLHVYIQMIKSKNISDYITDKMTDNYYIFYNDNEFIYGLIKTIKKESNENYKADMCIGLASIGKSDDYILDIIISTLKSGKIKFYKAQIITRLLGNFQKNDIIIPELIKIIENKNIKDDIYKMKIREGISLWENNLKTREEEKPFDRLEFYHINKNEINDYYIPIKKLSSSPISTNDEYIDALIKIVNDKTMDTYNDKKYAIVTLESIAIYDDRIVNLAMKYLDDKEHDLKGATSNLFWSINRDDDKFIDILYQAMTDENIEVMTRHLIARKLFNLNRSDNKFINVLIDLIETNEAISSETIDSSTLKQSMQKDFSIFEKLYKIVHDNMKVDVLGKNIHINVLFQAYDKGLDIKNILLSNLIYSNKSLYIKDNKLYTIEDGKEIRTSRDVNEKIIDALKKLGSHE